MIEIVSCKLALSQKNSKITQKEKYKIHSKLSGNIFVSFFYYSVLIGLLYFNQFGKAIAQFPNQPEGQAPSQMFQISWEGKRKLKLKAVGETVATIDFSKSSRKPEIKITAIKNGKKKPVNWESKGDGLEITPPHGMDAPYSLEVEWMSPESRTYREEIEVPSPSP